MGSGGVSRDCSDAKSFEVSGRELLAVDAWRFRHLYWSVPEGKASQVGARTRGWS